MYKSQTTSIKIQESRQWLHDRFLKIQSLSSERTHRHFFKNVSTMMSLDQQSATDEVNQQILHLQQDSDPNTFRTRTVNQPPIAIAPPKISELSARSDTYHMIPIERMEQIRKETAHVLDLGVDGEKQSRIRKLAGKKKKSNKKRRPSTRLRRCAAAFAHTINNNDQDSSSEDNTDEDDDDDDEPFIIKQSSAIKNEPDLKSADNLSDITSGKSANDV